MLATVEKIVEGVNGDGDRDFTLVLRLAGEDGESHVGFYTYERKSFFAPGQELEVTVTELTAKARRRLKKKVSDFETLTEDAAAFHAVPVNPEQYIDQNHRHFTKNAYPGDKTMLLYGGMVAAAALITALGILFAK